MARLETTADGGGGGGALDTIRSPFLSQRSAMKLYFWSLPGKRCCSFECVVSVESVRTHFSVGAGT